MQRCIAATLFYAKRRDYSLPLLLLTMMGWLIVILFNYFGPEPYQSTQAIFLSYLCAAGIVLGVELVLLIVYLVKVCWRCRGYDLLPTPQGHNQPYHEYRAWKWTLQERLDKMVVSKISDMEEVITASAVRGLDGTVYCVERPGRHHHCIWYMSQLDKAEQGVPGNTREQGFMTNRNHYLRREEARALAIRNGQAKEEKITNDHLIFSEDLWDTPIHMQHR